MAKKQIVGEIGADGDPQRLEARGERMTNSEHMVIAARRFGRGLKPWLVDGVEVQNWKSGPSIDEYLDQLGNEGWKVISVTEGLGWLASVPWFTRAKGCLYHLKRRKSSSAAGAGESER